MKKMFLNIILCLFISISANAEKVVGSYTLSYFDRTYDIEASEIKNGKFSIYIQVSAEREATKAMICVESSDLDKFKQSLIQTRDKYEEWSKVAKDNNVKDMSKEMDIKYPSMTVCWLGSKWFFSNQKLQPRFLIVDSGKHLVTFIKKVKASSNQYIDETIYWVFSSSKEIDELLSQLDFTTIKSKLEERESESGLFK